MEKTAITFVINGNTYSLRASDTMAIRKMPTTDRQQLIELLEAVKQQDQLALAAIQQRIETAKMSSNTTIPTTTKMPNPGQALGDKTTRLGSGDVDNLMAKLILEEKRSQKPMPTKQSLYKWIGVFLLVVILLFLIF